ncbi:MAG: arylsulfatase [Planctomycetaceae bacterium]|nr:arylsulfatase [Planctomycetaceae bacterium]
MLAVLCVATACSVFGADRPNIIVILADDMGYSDIGCYGSEIDTPNLDGLAADGLRFTQFYNTARCCPTRASLLTGLYPHQAGVGHMTNDYGFEGYRGNLNRKCLTFGEVLRPVGYRTYMSGKWHVTLDDTATSSKHNWPMQRGFDKFYGTISGAGSFWDPWSLVRQNTPISAFADEQYRPKKYYYTDAISDHAVRFIDSHYADTADQPFFMYVAYTAAHWPMHAPEKEIAKYNGIYSRGYQSLREQRFAKMKSLGVLSSESKLGMPAVEWSEQNNKEWDERNMEVYAAMVDCMDQGIGRIVDTLNKHRQLDNTLILYMQDNGGCAEALGRQPRKNISKRPAVATLQPMHPNDLQQKMIPDQTRDGFPTVMGPGVMAGPDGTYIAYGKGWANASNTPFREYKHWVHEGGISTPLIAHWPQGIKGQSRLEREPGHLVDIMATIVEVTGAPYPQSYNNVAIRPLEGESLTAAFAGGAHNRGPIFWEHEGNRAIRVNDWKLVAKGTKSRWELYNIANDREETNDLSAVHPNVAMDLQQQWTAYATRANVFPLNPRQARANIDKKKTGK